MSLVEDSSEEASVLEEVVFPVVVVLVVVVFVVCVEVDGEVVVSLGLFLFEQPRRTRLSTTADNSCFFTRIILSLLLIV